MAKKFSRQALYDLVWSKPKTTLAAELSISDVGLGKICQEARIPIPPRGYWARLSAGQKLPKAPLPRRGIGESDEVSVGRETWGFHEERITEIPPAPTFPETLEEVTHRASKLLGNLRVAKTLASPHHLIAKLLAKDDDRRKAAEGQTYCWDPPLFDDPAARRRLKILNTIFLMVSKGGFRPTLGRKNAEEPGVTVGCINVSFSITKIEQRSKAATGKNERPKARLQLEISNWAKATAFPPNEWRDTDDSPLEKHLPEIAVSLIVAGEMLYRGQAIWHHNCLIERKAEQDEKIRLAEEEAAREAEAARQADIKRRRDALLSAADNLQKATIIRAFVADAEKQDNLTGTPGFAEWRSWALTEADQIDPFSKGLEALFALAQPA